MNIAELKLAIYESLAKETIEKQGAVDYGQGEFICQGVYLDEHQQPVVFIKFRVSEKPPNKEKVLVIIPELDSDAIAAIQLLEQLTTDYGLASR